MEDNLKLDAHLIEIASGTAGGNVRQVEVQLDESYDDVIGVEAHEIDDGGTTGGYYQIGISDKDRAYVELAHKNALLTSASVPQSQKMRQVNFKIVKNRKTKVNIYWPSGNLASDLQVELVFTLRKRVV